MTMKSTIAGAIVCGTVATLATGVVSAHVSVTSGPGLADTTQKITFGVGHGCEGSDTLGVRIEIPPEIVSLRALDSNLGEASLELDDAGLVTAVSWEKPEQRLLESDTGYYELSVRIKVPNAPFTTLYFPTYQTCLSADGSPLEVAWVATSEEDPGSHEPAPELVVVPRRFPGWNRFEVPNGVSELAAFFGDALIVWKDDSAFSPNPSTRELILATPGVTELTALEPGDEIWVKY
jgi:periplasmic copper chaperone A